MVVTLPKTNIAHENPPFWWYLQGNMGIFMGYVSFREGKVVEVPSSLSIAWFVGAVNLMSLPKVGGEISAAIWKIRMY